MGIFKDYAVNSDLETNGVKIEYGENTDGTKETFIIARATARNDKFMKVSESVMKPYEKKMKKNELPIHKIRELNIEIFVNSLLIGWENIYTEDGILWEYSISNARKLMEMLPDLYDDLLSQCHDIETFKEIEENEKEIEKN